MESKGALKEILLFADKHLAKALEYGFMIGVLIIAWFLAKPLYENKDAAFKYTVLFFPFSMALIRWLAGEKYKWAVGYAYGTLLLLIIIAFRIFEH